MFFDRHFKKGLSWYQSHFRHGRSDQPVAEVAPTYFHSAAARERIARTIPHCKIICTLRDPVSRLYSLYHFMRHYGFTRVSFERALKDFPFMMGSSRYAHHVSEWQHLFPRTMVVLYQDLREDPQGYLDVVCRFLDLPQIPLPLRTDRVRRRPYRDARAEPSPVVAAPGGALTGGATRANAAPAGRC